MYIPTAFGTINVASLNNTAGSKLVASNKLASSFAPLPASVWLNPNGSLALVTEPFVITLTRCM